jgi:oligoendopeptidase F
MAEHKVLVRSEIEERFKWNAPSLFRSDEAWEEAYSSLAERIQHLAAFQGRLGESPEVLADALDLVDDLMERAGKVIVYASMTQAVDMANQEATKMAGRARSLSGRLNAAMAFLDPELLSLGQEKLAQFPSLLFCHAHAGTL